MNDKTKAIPAVDAEEVQISELGADALQAAAGGSLLGDIANVAEGAASDVAGAAKWAYDHPADVALAGAAIGAAAVGGAAVVSAVSLGQGTLAGAAGWAAAGAALGDGVADGVEAAAHGISDAVSEMKKIL